MIHNLSKQLWKNDWAVKVREMDGNSVRVETKAKSQTDDDNCCPGPVALFGN